MDEEELEDKLYDIYLNGLNEDRGYYAREAETSGLLAVYKAGLEAGRQEKN